MNPLTKVKLINELNEREADLGIKDSVSWHTQYKDSAWVFIGGFPYELTEGDIICVFSQYGEIANINLVRDKKTGKSKGFCFMCYEDQRSTILAVDNLNGIKIKGRTLRVDHVANYRPPKDSDDIDDITKKLREEGCAPKPPSSPESSDDSLLPAKKPKKDKKEKKKKKKEKKEKKKALKEEKSASQAKSASTPALRVKKEKEDTGYEKYALMGAESRGQETRTHRDRLEDPDRSRFQHGSDRRDRERDRDEERRTDLRDKERGREGERERDRGREYYREREQERDRGDREPDMGKKRERDTDRYRESSSRENERERDHDKERTYNERGRDRDTDRKHSYDQEYRRH